MRPRADLRVSVKTGHWAAINCRNYHTRAWKHIQGDSWENNARIRARWSSISGLSVSHPPLLSALVHRLIEKNFLIASTRNRLSRLATFDIIPDRRRLSTRTLNASRAGGNRYFATICPHYPVYYRGNDISLLLGKHLCITTVYKWSTGVRLRPNFVTSFSLLSSPLPFSFLSSPIYTIFRKVFERGHDDWRSTTWLSFPIMIIVRSSVITLVEIFSRIIAIGKKIPIWKILSKLSLL